MLYATNGKVQDLPSNSQFDFWNQVDWGIAFNIAKVEQNLLVGADRAPHQRIVIDLMMEAVNHDKWSVFKSRPKGQQINWEGWGKFCSYYLRSDSWTQSAIAQQILAGYVAAWFPKFLASNVRAAGGSCFWYKNAPSIVFWDFHVFDLNKCRSTRKLPETWPTPQEIAMVQAYAAWWEGLLGKNEAQKMVNSPPTDAERAQAPISIPEPAPPGLPEPARDIPNILLPDEDEDKNIHRCGEGNRLNPMTKKCEPTGGRAVIDLSKLTDEALAQTGAPFETVAEFKAALEGPYQQQICDWFNHIGAQYRSEVEPRIPDGKSIEDHFGKEPELRANIKPWSMEVKSEWPELNAEAYERYLHCFLDGIFHPPAKKSSGLVWVAGAGAVGLGLWLLLRRG